MSSLLASGGKGLDVLLNEFNEWEVGIYVHIGKGDTGGRKIISFIKKQSVIISS
jgi:hypothetical protein